MAHFKSQDLQYRSFRILDFEQEGHVAQTTQNLQERDEKIFEDSEAIPIPTLHLFEGVPALVLKAIDLREFLQD